MQNIYNITMHDDVHAVLPASPCSTTIFFKTVHKVAKMSAKRSLQIARALVHAELALKRIGDEARIEVDHRELLQLVVDEVHHARHQLEGGFLHFSILFKLSKRLSSFFSLMHSGRESDFKALRQ